MRMRQTAPRGRYCLSSHVGKLELWAHSPSEAIMLAHLRDCLDSGDFREYRKRLLQKLRTAPVEQPSKRDAKRRRNDG